MADFSSPLLLTRARIIGREGLQSCDLRLRDGRITMIGLAGSMAPQHGEITLAAEDGIVMPAFVDLHTHLDKGHIWPRRDNPDGTFANALRLTAADRAANWSRRDIEARMDFALRCAYAHGTRAIRTHLDCKPPQHRISWPLFADMRKRWAGRIELQATALIGPDDALDKTIVEQVARTVQVHGGQLGGAIARFDRAREAVENLVEAAGQHGLDLDLHLDESGDAQSRVLRLLADHVSETRLPGRVLVGHCCSLAVQPEAEASDTIERVARAGIAIVSLPMCNLYLQDRRAGCTPRWRGVTLLRELRAAGVSVSLASDNTRDPFYAYGDLDMVEVLRESVRIGHLDHPGHDMPAWIDAVTLDPARTGGFAEPIGVEEGAPADLVVFRARTFNELLARPQSDRIVIRGGRILEATLPDYRELDSILGVSP